MVSRSIRVVGGLTVSVAALSASLGSSTAWAQQPLATLEEVIVTARKREENLQDAPLSISATTAVDIERLGIREIGDLLKMRARRRVQTRVRAWGTRASRSAGCRRHAAGPMLRSSSMASTS